MIDTGFRIYLASLNLIASTTMAGSIQQESIDQNGPDDYIWFHRRSSSRQLNLDGSTRGFIESAYDIELVSNNIDTAQTMADTLKETLNGYRGDMDESYCYGAFVEDHSDDYIQANGQDDGKHVCSLDVTLIHN